MKYDYDVFISYSRRDTAVADKVCEAFDRAGIKYFIDRQCIGGFLEFPTVLAQSIVNSRLFLLLASKNAYESRFTTSEIIFAFNKKGKNSILPYIIDNEPLPLYLQFTFAGINHRFIKHHPIDTTLVDDILKMLGRERTDITPAPTPPRKPINWRAIFKKMAIPALVCCIIVIPIYLGVERGYLAMKQALIEEAIQKSLAEVKERNGVYQIGDYYNDGSKEGVVFEVSADGKSGKIVSMKQSAIELQWSSVETEYERTIGADSETDGAYNMAKVTAVPNWQDKYPAFKWCTDLGEGWYLPAKHELKAIYENKNRICSIIWTSELSYYLWSSTEINYQKTSGEFCAWDVNMDDGNTYRSLKCRNLYVRAVSTFERKEDGAQCQIGNIEMVFVKGGTFTMGATSEQGSDALSDEKPAHQVTVSDFYIGKYEVTQAQWRAVMGSIRAISKAIIYPLKRSLGTIFKNLLKS